MARSSRLTKPASQDLLRLEVVAVRRLAQLRRHAPGRLAALAVAATPLAIAH